jgi:hypothetical protein
LNANKTITRYYVTPHSMAITKMTHNKSIGEDLEKLELSYVPGGN